MEQPACDIQQTGVLQICDLWHGRLSLPNVFPARALYGIGGRLLRELLFTDWTGLGDHVCHNRLPPVFRKACCPHASASLPPQLGLSSCSSFGPGRREDHRRNTLKNRQCRASRATCSAAHTNRSFLRYRNSSSADFPVATPKVRRCVLFIGD
jgi:hypothetical protein